MFTFVVTKPHSLSESCKEWLSLVHKNWVNSQLMFPQHSCESPRALPLRHCGSPPPAACFVGLLWRFVTHSTGVSHAVGHASGAPETLLGGEFLNLNVSVELLERQFCAEWGRNIKYSTCGKKLIFIICAVQRLRVLMFFEYLAQYMDSAVLDYKTQSKAV